MSSSQGSSSWSVKENKIFENALATFDKDTLDRFDNVAKAVGTKTVEQVKRHYDLLLQDVRDIESGRFPLPRYGPIMESNPRNTDEDQQQRRRNRRPQ